MKDILGSTRWRLVGWSVLVVGIILLAVGATLYLTVTRKLLDAVDTSLITSSQMAQVELNETGEADELERQGYRGGLFYLVLNGAGAVVANPQQVQADSLPSDLVGAPLPRLLTADIGGQPARVYARQIVDPDTGPVTLVVGESLGAVQTAGQQLLLVVSLGAAIGLVLSFVGAWFLAERALIPMQRAFQRQQEFVADASHELRTPLTILHSTTELLVRGEDDPVQVNRDVLDEVHQEVVRMERLTRALLTLARSDRGELRLALGRLDLGRFAGELERRVHVLADSRGISLHVETAEPSAVVEADPDRLQQVGLIVLDNALNHTPVGGHICLRVRQEHKLGILEIDDTGEGIPREHLARVFDRFHRVDPSRSRQTGGAGLGLAIAHSLMVAHRGQITVGSRPGGGTRVTVSLPLAPPEPALPDEPARATLGVR